jgi:hypothetical protein
VISTFFLGVVLVVSIKFTFPFWTTFLSFLLPVQ